MARIKYCKSWDKAQDAELIQMVKDGVCREEIAQHFGRTESAIQSRVSHLRNYAAQPLPMLRSQKMIDGYEREAEQEVAPDTLTAILSELRAIRDLLFDMKVNTDAINAELLK